MTGKQMKPIDRIAQGAALIRIANARPEFIGTAGEMQPENLVAEAHYIISKLMDFRNIVNAAISFEQEPLEALEVLRADNDRT